MLRALIAGSDADEITDLAPRATRLFGTSCNYFAIEADQTTTELTQRSPHWIEGLSRYAGDPPAGRWGRSGCDHPVGCQNPITSRSQVVFVDQSAEHIMADDLVERR